MFSTPATCPLTEYFQAIARGGWFRHDRPFPWTSPSCTCTKTKTPMAWRCQHSSFQFAQPKQLSMNSPLCGKELPYLQKAQGFSQSWLLDLPWQMWQRIWKLRVFGLICKNKATLEKSLKKCINLNLVYFGLTIKTFIKSYDPVLWIIL